MPQKSISRRLFKNHSGQKDMITIVVAVLNGDRTLARCIGSIVSQTYAHKELIVIDGGSTDRSMDILKSFQAGIAYFKSEKDSGIYHAWNKGVMRAKGDWICFLGADDFFWDRDVLKSVARNLEEAKTNIVYGKLNIVDRHGSIIDSIGDEWHRSRRLFLQGQSLPHPALFYRRHLFTEHGLFDQSFKVAGDYEFLLRELKKHDARFIPDVAIAGMEKGGLSLRSENIRLILNEITTARRKNGVARFSPYIFFGNIRTSVRSAITTLFGKKASDVVSDFYRIAVRKKRFWTR